MQKTRRELLDDFVQFMGESEDVEARNTAERVLNRAVLGIWLKHAFQEFRSPVPFELTCVVNQMRYALPDYFGRVGPGHHLRNLTRGGRPIAPRQAGDLAGDFPSTGTTSEQASSPIAYEVAGVCGVHTQPASTGQALEVVSSDAADTDVVVAIAGDDSFGRWTRNQVTLTGTTAVAIGTWAFVDEFGKAYPASVTPATELTSSRGTVTLRRVSDAAELQRLFPQESAHEHAVLALYPKPNAADVIAIPVIRKPKRLFQDADVLPWTWEAAIWEAMTIEWGVNTGEIPKVQAGSVPRPALVDLICYDNETARAGASYTVPFGGR